MSFLLVKYLNHEVTAKLRSGTIITDKVTANTDHMAEKFPYRFHGLTYNSRGGFYPNEKDDDDIVAIRFALFQKAVEE